MRVVVLGRNRAGSRSHYIIGFHGPGCVWLELKFICNLDHLTNRVNQMIYSITEINSNI